MDRIITNNVWSQVKKLIGKQNKVAAIAYVSKGTPLSFRRGDTLICDASDNAIKTGETDAGMIKSFLQAGASVYSCPTLHAKLLVSGDMAVVGSANLSASSENYLVEASLITTRTQIRSQVSALIYNIVKASTLIDGDFVTHICSLPVTRHFRPNARHKKSITRDIGNRYWIVHTRLLETWPAYEDQYIEEGEGKARERTEDKHSDISWIRWVGKGRFRELAKPGDTLIEIMRRGTRYTVMAPRPILFRQNQEKWARFYLELPSDLETISWTRFEKKLRQVGLHSIKKNSTRELRPTDIALMEVLWQPRLSSRGHG